MGLGARGVGFRVYWFWIAYVSGFKDPKALLQRLG